MDLRGTLECGVFFTSPLSANLICWQPTSLSTHAISFRRLLRTGQRDNKNNASEFLPFIPSFIPYSFFLSFSVANWPPSKCLSGTRYGRLPSTSLSTHPLLNFSKLRTERRSTMALWRPQVLGGRPDASRSFPRTKATSLPLRRRARLGDRCQVEAHGEM